MVESILNDEGGVDPCVARRSRKARIDHIAVSNEVSEGTFCYAVHFFEHGIRGQLNEMCLDR